MEEAQRIFYYLPVSFRNTNEQDYILFLWETFQNNYESGKYPFAFLAYHMLFMCFVYFEIWQVKTNFQEDFQKAMIGFRRDVEEKLVNASTPFSLCEINESNVFRFFKLIGMSNEEISLCTKIVKERNNAAHTNGNVYFRNQADIDRKVIEILQCIEKIQGLSKKTILSFFEKFLLENSDVENREYLEDSDQIQEVLIHRNYLSFCDIVMAQEFDVTELEDHINYSNITNLVHALNELFPKQEDTLIEDQIA